jgi:hypothetical protein
MSVNVCPAAVIQAPLEIAWSMLCDPAGYSEWWDARTTQIVPPGPAQPGQVVNALSRAAGQEWPVSITVVAIDPDRHQLELTARLPLGITVHNHISVATIGADRCRIQFG